MNAVIYPKPAPIAHAPTPSGALAPPHSAAIEVTVLYLVKRRLTVARVREPFYWPGYHNDVCEWCKFCPDCASVMAPPGMNQASLKSPLAGG